MVLYGCETWCLTLREEHRLRVFVNRVLRRMFGPKRDDETGGWIKLKNKELHNLLYSSLSKIRTRKSRKMLPNLVMTITRSKPPLGKPRRRWVNNIEMDLGEIGLGVMGWIGLAQDKNQWKALVYAVMNFRFQNNAGISQNGCTTGIQ
jgi:hypothetical protein